MNAEVQATPDWRAYFNDFCTAHGNNAILCRGRLVFADGWSHSSTSYAGPEWSPPEGEELRQLMLAYWNRRCIIVTDERDELRRDIESYKAMSYAKSVPLRFVTGMYDKEQGLVKAEYIDFAEYMERCLGRLSWLEEDVATCHSKLAALREMADATTQR